MKRTILEVLPRVSSLGMLAVILCSGDQHSCRRKSDRPLPEGQTADSPILSVVFDDPLQVFAAFPDGISREEIQNVSDVHEKEVATGTGGSAKLEVAGGDWNEAAASCPRPSSCSPIPTRVSSRRCELMETK